jgi:xylan 1,4-beta-xylosidase
VTIILRGALGSRRAALYRLDATHGSPAATYEQLGKPPYPTQAQIAQLRRASQIPPPELIRIDNGKITISLPPQGLALIEIH